MSGIKRTAADKWFSDYIRIRDKWTCQRCYRKFRQEELQGLDCGHLHTRGHNMTRFNPDNCLSFCYGCHSYLDANPKLKDELFLKHIGSKKFNELERLSKVPYTGIKKDQKVLSAKFRALFRDLLKKRSSTIG